jgi:hypothetical protein
VGRGTILSDGQAGDEANGGGDDVRVHFGDVVGLVVRVCREGDMWEGVQSRLPRRKEKW